jgi:hypothetical protein
LGAGASPHHLTETLLCTHVTRVRHGIVDSGGDACARRHDFWLRYAAYPRPTGSATRLAFDAGYGAVLAVTASGTNARPGDGGCEGGDRPERLDEERDGPRHFDPRISASDAWPRPARPPP